MNVAWRPPITRPLPVIQPISYAQAYRSPSMMSFRIPSPTLSTLDGPVIVPDDVRRAGEARRKEAEEEYRQLVEAAEAKVRAQKEHDLAEERRQDEEYRSRLAAMEARDAEDRRSRTYFTEDDSDMTASWESAPSLADSRSSLLSASRRHSDQMRRRARSADKDRRKSAEAVEAVEAKKSREQRKQAALKELAKRRKAEEELRKAEDAARIRGAEAAAYFMAKQDLERPRLRRGSTTTGPGVNGSYDPTMAGGRAGTLSPRADAKARALPTSRSLRRKQTDPGPASVPVGPMQSPPLLPRDRPARGSGEPLMMPPRFIPGGIPTDSPAQEDERPDTPAMFIVVSGDRVPGYSHDVIQTVVSSVVQDVGSTPAQAFISGTEKGKNDDREGKRAAVEKLVDMAEKVSALPVEL